MSARFAPFRFLAVGAAAALLAGCAGGEAAVDDAPPPPVRGQAAPVSDTVAALDVPEVATVAVFLARDPFRPVVPAAVDGTGAGGAGVDGPVGDGTGTDPAVDPSPCTETAAGPVCDGELVELLDVRDDGGVERADVRVGGALYTVGEGDRFATSYLVESIDVPCVSFLHGDELFTICEGQQVLK